MHGVKVDTIFNGFTNFYPIIDNGKYLGSAEISNSFQFIAKKIENVLNNKVAFVLKKEQVIEGILKLNRATIKYATSQMTIYAKAIIGQIV